MVSRLCAGLALVSLLSMARPASAEVTNTPRGSERMPAQGGTVVIKVVDYQQARESVLEEAARQGAEVLDSHTESDLLGKKSGWLRLSAPADRLRPLLTGVYGVGKLYAESIQAPDQRTEYEELERRIESLRKHEQRLDRLLSDSRRLRGSDILYLQERVFRAGVDEGLLLQRRVNLERSARQGTVVVELFEPEPRRTMDLGNWYAGSSLRAQTDLYRLLAKGLTGGAYVLFFAPLWIPVLILMVVLGRWLWKNVLLRVFTEALIVWRWIGSLVRARFPNALASGPASSDASAS